MHIITSIALPSTVTEIGQWTFCNCNKLREVVFNEGLQKIGVYAFYQCTSLSSITIPSTVTEIVGRAFSDCISLREVTFKEGLLKIAPQ